MASAPSGNPSTRAATTVESHCFSNTYIQRSRPYLTATQIDSLRPTDTQDEARDTSTRLNACSWIAQVGKALQFPVRTTSTAMVLYHRLVLFNRMPYMEHNWTEAAAAALFVACKIEDTLKKSREILAASYNIRHPQSEPINPDSNLLDESSKRVIGMERMVLETTSFDFRNRHAQPFVVKLCRHFKVSKGLAHRAWDMSVDVYRTLAPLRATPHALALASLDLAARLENENIYIDCAQFETDQECVLSVVDDLLDLYSNHTTYSDVGRLYDNTLYLNARIDLNRERKKLANGGTHLPTRDSVPHPVSANLPDRGTNGTIRFMINPEREFKETRLLITSPDGGMGRTKPIPVVNGATPPRP